MDEFPIQTAIDFGTNALVLYLFWQIQQNQKESSVLIRELLSELREYNNNQMQTFNSILDRQHQLVERLLGGDREL
ncbi:hypothetical protein ACL6C3_16870 [Capilliphycus salinus ALCB114379]|uniref:hypothetical protein n=1 Tax=Capilliphycus salinus TaxID=2768948 RepID=UPI0039A53D79